MPVFTFFDGELNKQDKQEAARQRKKQCVKSKFVGSPVRSPEEGGVMTHKYKERFDPAE